MSECGETKQPECGPCGEKKRGKVWHIIAGSLFSRILRIRRKTGGSFDLAGYGVRCYLRKTKYDFSEPPYAEATCEVTDAAKGKVRVRLGASTTRLMVDTGFFDVEVYSKSDPEEVYRVLQGAYEVDLEVTTV